MLPRSLALGVLAALSGACTHITTSVPGVLDLRSDGAGAAVDTKAPTGARGGFDALMDGDGVTGTAGEIKVEDRKYWVCGLLPVLNESATEEINAAVGPGAMRNVRIGEQFTVLNWFTGACVRALPVVNIAGIIMPPRDFRFWGTRIAAPEGVPPPADGLPAEDAAAPAPIGAY